MGSCISTEKSLQKKKINCDAKRPLGSQKSGGGQGEGVTDPSAYTKPKQGVEVKCQDPWSIEMLITPFRNVSDVILCLYETQNEIMVRRALSRMPNLWITRPYSKKNMEHLLDRALSYCLEKSEIEHSISFTEYTMTDETQRMLSSGLRKCSDFKLDKCKLTPSLSEELCSIIARCSLLSLTLTHVNLQNSEVKRLCEGLRHPDSVLKSLCLENCGLTTSCCEDLHSLLITLPSLIILHLSGNDLKDSGVKRLCEDLRHPRCVLRHVGFRECNLTPAICDDIRSFILSNPSMYHLDLSENKFQKSGVMRLCEVFRHPDCHLDELRLNNCGQGFFRIKELNSYVVKTPTVTNVDLTFTALGDLNVHKICVTLDYPECNLQEMRLEHVHLTSHGCNDLCTIIRNRSLLRLNLSHNYLMDPGIMRLRFGLNHPGCVLQELELVRCGLTSYCCDDLRSIITNPSLIKLDVSRNNLQDSGVKLLCEGLRDPRCVLQELRLERCGLTSSCCEDLLSVITNRSLIKLDLSRNNLQDSGVMRLCEGLRDPDCTLQELRLRHCNLTSSGMEYLQNTENHPRTKLDLSCNNVEESVIACSHCLPY